MWSVFNGQITAVCKEFENLVDQLHVETTLLAQLIIFLKLLSSDELIQNYLLRNEINSFAFLCLVVLPFFTCSIAFKVIGLFPFSILAKGSVFTYSKKPSDCLFDVSITM